MREAHAFLYLGYSRHLASLTARMAQRLRSRSQVQTAWVCIPVLLLMASLVAQMVKNLPAMQETQIWSLGREDTLEQEMATPSSRLAWRIPWMEEPSGLHEPMHGVAWATNTTLSLKSCGTFEKSHNFSVPYIPCFLNRNNTIYIMGCCEFNEMYWVVSTFEELNSV